jgi:hypothetical protein
MRIAEPTDPRTAPIVRLRSLIPLPAHPAKVAALLAELDEKDRKR